MPLTPEQRRLRAQIAAYARWADEDRDAQGARVQESSLAKFERDDPNNELEPKERLRRAICARKAHMLRMALASTKARSARAGRRDGAA